MKKKYIVISILICIAAAICAVIGVRHYLEEQNAVTTYEKIREETGSGTDEPDRSEEDSPVEIPVDFDALKEINADVYAWITIPGTAVDYPILQSESDNGYYLTHTIDHKVSAEGAIYTEDYNNKDFEDPNTLIYGHDMKNGTMFGGLLEYQDRAYFDEHTDLLIYTPDAVRTYRIFAAYVYDDRHIMQSFDFGNIDVYRDYLDGIFSIRDMSSCIDTTADVDADDKIITLSTCYGSQDDKRYLVQAVLVSIENTEKKGG